MIFTPSGGPAPQTAPLDLLNQMLGLTDELARLQGGQWTYGNDTVLDPTDTSGYRGMLSCGDDNSRRFSVLIFGPGASSPEDATTVRRSTSQRKASPTAREFGNVTGVVHTAGLSPVQATVDAIWKVDLYGVAVVLEEFEKVIAPGGAGVVIASMAGYLGGGSIPADTLASLAAVPADDLLLIPFVAEIDNAGQAYSVAKRANQVRVQAASLRWGARGARVNSISPGVISTPMGQQELAGESGAQMRAMIEGSGTRRVGTPADIANAAAFLLGSDASFITGTDLLVDGGVVAAVDTGSRIRTAG